jgi:glycosyltransferase involved in cell wall biosynthesis
MTTETTPSETESEYVLVTEYFHPDTASTGRLMTELAVGLRDRGLDLSVYTGQPNYHSGDNERQPTRSTHEGVPVRRIGAPQTRQTSLPRRLANWFLFTLWMSLVLLTDRTSSDRHLVFVSNPPFLPLAMWAVCRLRGWEYTYIVYDLYPDNIVELGHIEGDGVIDRAWSYLHRLTLDDATDVVALGPVMEERIVEAAGPEFDPDTVRIIHNWQDESFIEPVAKAENPFSREHGFVDPFTVLYSGNIGEFHDLGTLVRAAAAFEDEDVRFVIVGEGDDKDRIVELAESLEIGDDTLTFLPYQPWERVPYSLTSADVSVVSLRRGFEGLCVSSKLYSAMAAGGPVLCIARADDDESRIVEMFDAGLQVPQGDVEELVEAVERWREDPSLVERQGRNARAAFEANFTREQCVDDYYELLAGDAPPTRRSGDEQSVAS